jgi:hypothetical protein
LHERLAVSVVSGHVEAVCVDLIERLFAFADANLKVIVQRNLRCVAKRLRHLVDAGA